MPSAIGPASPASPPITPPVRSTRPEFAPASRPEPNGYLHFGHAKSILLNFGLAEQYGGRCHLRFDDTNPEKEEQEYVDSIIDAVHWLGCSWEKGGETNLYQASNYFDWMAQFAEYLISAGHAYVDSQSAEEMRANRGTLTQPGKDSPYPQPQRGREHGPVQAHAGRRIRLTARTSCERRST